MKLWKKYIATQAAWRGRNPEKIKEYRKRSYEKNKAAINERNRLADLRDPERVKRRQRRRRRHHLKLYGITLDQYYQLYAAQDGKCAICEIKAEVLNVDHNHTSGKVRGLLCHFCNLGIGNLRDDLNLVKKAAIYLETYHA